MQPTTSKLQLRASTGCIRLQACMWMLITRGASGSLRRLLSGIAFGGAVSAVITLQAMGVSIKVSPHDETDCWDMTCSY